MNNSPLPLIVRRASLLAASLLLSSGLAHAQVFYVSSPSSGTIDAVDSTGTSSVWLTGLNNPYSLTMDSSGALYVEQLNGTILEYADPSTSTTGSTFVASGVQSLSIAVDGSGNVCQANLSAGNIVTYNSAGTQTSSFVASGLVSPRGIALDSDGNIYSSNYSAKTVTKYSSAGSLLETYTLTGASNLQGIVVDSSGTIYVTSGGDIYSITGAGTISMLYDGSVQLYGLTLYGGDLYTVTGSQSILKIDLSGNASTFATSLSSGAQWITVAIPEPGTWAALIGGASGLLVLLVRLRRSVRA